ncbi:hypothetical protein ES707_03925 [subsurface metagenome]
MENEGLIRELVKGLPENHKFDIIQSLTETELHKEIKELLAAMYPNNYVAITHGSEELGRDLVIVSEDPLGDRVMGVVVKTGDIRSKASGAIDKIKDQVEEAFSHPVSLKGFEFESDLDITFVTVIIAGILSRQAVLRLRREINKPINRPNTSIRDLKWLVDNFTRYYPYVFYEGEVSRYLESTLQDLETKHMFSGRQRSLSECYVEPTIASYGRIIELKDSDITLTILKNRISFKQLEKEVQPLRKFLVVGDPGVGKSTALVKMAIDILSDGLRKATRSKIKEKISIPIFITARKFWGLNSVEELVQGFGPSVETRERFQIVTLLVDALDEVDSDYREALLDKASKFIKELNCALIISTRKIDIVKRETLGYEKRELLPFEFGQALVMLGRLVKDENMLEALKDGLKRIESQITITPLSLLLLIELVEEEKEVPASITELYDRFTDIALGKYDRSRKGIDVLFDFEVKKRFLAELAFREYFEKEQAEISASDFESFINTYAKEFKWDTKQLKGFIGEIERAGLLDIRKSVKFRHGSFLDYFIALKIHDTREEIPELYDYLTKIYFDDVWGDVAFYFAGLRKNIPKRFIDKIYGFDSKKRSLVRSIQKLLVGKVLQAAWHSKSNVKLYGIGRSLEYSDRIIEQFLILAREANPLMPAIYADIYSLIVCEMSFGSRFLLNENRELINIYLKNPKGKTILRSLRLLWSMKGKIEDQEVDKFAGQLYEATKTAQKITGEEYAKSLLLLRVMATKEKAVYKAIQKRVQKELRTHPHLFAKLAPQKKQMSITEEQRRKARAKRRKTK